ncbi:glycosyl hydrolase [Roseivirga sp. UBA1976]|uniref:VPS10 domain-containing protein n=1 Tax=Roseivirga sp. UBA1976 TaxID=1947386 RepID=UPI00257C2EE1|nr:glycosyl hydrolase [Roseivirga sp. UBA1976]
MNKLFFCIALIFSVLEVAAQSADQYFQPLKYRNIGPFRGGRSVNAMGVVGNPTTYYMGTTGGGLWKTEDAGQRWFNISDGFFKTGSVGAIAVSEAQPNIIYVGMGEHAPRGVMTSYGDGVYKSTDSGKTWKHMGLEATQHIARIVVHPSNPDIVWVAAQGALHGPNKERGIYKSVDGGKTWKQVLFVNESTGCSELSLDMNAPNTLYATMWEHERKPWKVISGGEGSGVYKSMDGGESWFKIEKGLPNELGKMAIAVSRANSDKVYALIESDSNKDLGGLFVSNNAGKSWSRVSDDNRLTQRAWYYTEVFTDPNDEHTVYVLSAPALKSIDGGKTWQRITGTHGDYHDLWINPNNSKNMVIANDGGAAISFDGGEHWSTQSNMPTAQFYRINVDNLFPYNIYGGQQDNSSVKIASMALGSGSIGERNWWPSAGGESAFLAFDPDNPRYVMGGSYLGTIELMDMESNGSTNVMEAPIQYLGKAARDMKYLFNWNAPIIWSKHEPGTFYHAAQKVLRTRDKGITWEEISPDLTRNIDEKQGNGGGPYTNEAVGAENYGTIAYLMESPHEAGVFWTGSDDGLVHLTRDNGKTWQNVTPKGLQECLVNAIEVSPHDPATAYIATTRYKFNDKTPAIYKTTNYGQSWTNISEGIPYGAFTRVVREDKKRKDLLYAGTETGIYISWNGGKKWEPFQLNMPVTPINDLMVHQDDLIVATSGRSFWILDDLSLLAQYENKPGVKLYEPAETVYGSWSSPLNGNSADGTSDFAGVNPASGMVIYYELPKGFSGDVELEIADANGRLIRRLSSKEQKDFVAYDGGPSRAPRLSANEGLNRFVWDTRHPIMPGVTHVYIEGSYNGHKVAPGEYQLRLKAADQTLTTKATIVANPLYDVSNDDYMAYDAIMSEMEANLTQMHRTVNQLYKVRHQLKTITETLEGDLKEESEALIEALTAWDNDMVQRMSKAYDDVENFPNKFTAEYLFLINQAESSIPKVTQAVRDRKAELDAQWKRYEAQAREWMNSTIPGLNEKLWNAGIGAIRLGK